MDDTTTDQLTALSGNDVPSSRSRVAPDPTEATDPENQPQISSDDERCRALMLDLLDAQRRVLREAGRVRAIYDACEDAIVEETLEGTITGWNRSAERLYGYSAAEVLGKRSSILLPPGTADDVTARSERAKRQERVEQWETVRVRKDGRRVEVLLRTFPIRDAERRPVGLLTIAGDITATKRAEEEQRFLAEASSLLSRSLDYETTLDSIATLTVPTLADICLVDMIEGKSVRQRSAAQADSPYDDCLRSIQVRYSLDPDSPHPVWDVLRTGEPKLIDGEADPTSDSERRESELLASLREAGMRSCMVVPIIIRNRPAGAISLIVSVHSRRGYATRDLALAEELAARVAATVESSRLYEDARRAVKARDEFLSIAAHELKTPMTSLRGFVQLAIRQLDRNGTPDPVQTRQALTVIDQQSRKLSNLISQLLDVSRLEAGRLGLERQLVDVGKLVEDVVATVLAGSTEHAVVVRIPAVVLALVDPVRVEQVTTNLLDNAIRYSPPGSLIEVELTQPSRETVRLAVRDRGPGIPAEMRSRIFTRFNHAHASDQVGGMGLGLYISHEIVVLHGGRIDAEFPEDGGTRLVVTLPSGLSESEATGD